MVQPSPFHASRPLGRAVLTLGAIAATYYIFWLAASPFLATNRTLAALFPPASTAVATARAAGGLIAAGTLAYCACVMLGAALVRDDPSYVPPALQPGRGTVKKRD